MKYFDFL